MNRLPKSPWTRMAPAGFALLLASSCLVSGGDVIVRHARPDGRKISVPGPMSTEYGLADTDKWPHACSMIDNEEIRAIFPQVKEIHRDSRSYEAKVGSSDIDPNATEQKVIGGVCVITLTLPNDHAEHHNVRLNIKMKAVGTPAVVRRNYPHQLDERIFRVNAGEDQCSRYGSGEFACRKNRVAFSMNFYSTYVTYKGAKDDEAAKRAFERKHVLPAFAKTMVAKIP